MKIFWLGFTGFLIALTFQNCGGDFLPSQELGSYQAHLEEMNAMDQKLLPQLLSSESLVLWHNKEGEVTPMTDPLFLEAMTLVGVFRPEPGELFSLLASDTQAVSISLIGNKLTVAHRNPISSATFIETILPEPLEKTFVIAARFGKNPTDIALMINGLMVGTAADVKSEGPSQVLPFSYLEMKRTGSAVEELMVFTTVLQPQAMNTLSRHLAIRRGMLPTAFQKIPDLDQANPANPNFIRAQAIIKQKCVACHSWAGLAEEQFFTTLLGNGKPLVKKGDLENSQLWIRLIGVDEGGQARKNMPLKDNAPAGADTAPLNAEQLGILRNWILN